MPRASIGPQLRPNPKKYGIYYIFWTEKRGARSVSRERSTGTRDRAAAHQAFAEWLEAGGGTDTSIRWDGPRRASQATIADVLAVYAQEHAAGHTAAPERTGYAIVPLLAWWGERTCDYIKPETCRAYVRWRTRDAGISDRKRMAAPSLDNADERAGRGYTRRSRKDDGGDISEKSSAAVQDTKNISGRKISESTAARELIVLRAALGYAHKNGKLIDRPFVELPSKGPGRDRWLTRSEAAALLWESRRDPHARLHLPLFIMLALRTGARPGALFDLRWTQIDFDRDRIDFNPPGRKRTNKQRPIISIPRRLRWFLLRAHARATSPYVLSYKGQKLASVKRSFREARKRAGLGDEVIPYTLRHSAGCWLAQAGVDLWIIGGWLGHSNERTTELYLHHSPEHLAKARKVMD